MKVKLFRFSECGAKKESGCKKETKTAFKRTLAYRQKKINGRNPQNIAAFFV